MDTNHPHLVNCLLTICDPENANNPLAWFDLEQAGITREMLRKLVDRGEWYGPPPVFHTAPDRNGMIWKYLSSKRGTQ